MIAAAMTILLAVQAAAPPSADRDGCRVDEGVEDILGAPLPIGRVTADPVVVAPDAVLAQEVLQVATRVWRTAAPFDLPGYRFTYPAGVRVTALRSGRGDERGGTRLSTRPVPL